MHRDTLAQVLLNERLEWGHETFESDFGGLEAAAQRAGVVALWERLLLGRHLRGPEVVGLFSLGHAIRRNLGICPDEGSITIKLRPVALPKISICQVFISANLHSRLAFRSWTQLRYGSPPHGDRGREQRISRRSQNGHSVGQPHSRNAPIGSWYPWDRKTRPSHTVGQSSQSLSRSTLCQL